MNFMRKTGSRREDEEKKHPPVSYRRHGWLTEEEEGGVMTVEREHMFDKVVTPSDVGKLNRLVIPKQHAERYFPLDSSSNEKGLLLNFEDRNGKKWWFRYSYWTSSQSYVMTKGWSRFVKEKNLDAGDVVSFHRGVGVSAKDRLFIDWKRRVTPFDHNLFNPPPPNSNTSSYTTSTCSSENVNNGGSRSLAYFRQQQHFEMIQMQQRSGFGIGINPPPPTPTIHGKASGKRIRLFGVNMDYYPLSEDEHDKNYDTPSESGHAIVAAYSTINPFSTGHYKFCHRLSPRPLVIPQSSSSSSPRSSSIPYLQLSPNGEGEGRNRSWIFQASSAHAINIIDISTASRMSLDLNI